MAKDDERGAGARGWRGAGWLALLALAIVELVGHAVIQARVVPDDDWARAAEVVREGHEPGDLVVVAPGWADPLLRRELGELMSLEDAAPADLAQHRRLWALSIRGHRPAQAPETPPELSQQVGRVRVLRWTLPQTQEVLYDLVDHVAEARVTRVEGDRELPCRFVPGGRPQGGGLGAGPVTPARRHLCDPARPWLWVGETVLDDLDLQPRRCVWQHPQGAEPIRARFSNVPLGDELVLYADLYYEHERHQENGPIDVVVFVDGEEVGRMTHRDGDGWKRMVASTHVPRRGERDTGEVRVEVTAENPHLRTLCWAATTRSAPR